MKEGPGNSSGNGKQVQFSRIVEEIPFDDPGCLREAVMDGVDVRISLSN